MARKGKKTNNFAHKRQINRKGSLLDRWVLVLYQWLSKNILTRKTIYHIRSRFEIIDHHNERSLRLKVTWLYISVMFFYMLVIGLIIKFNQDLIMVGLWTVVLWVISQTIIDFMVVRLKNRLLWQQLKFNELVRHYYYQTRMVDEAIYETCQELSSKYYQIILQGERMYEILLARDPEKEMLSYYEVAPNKFLKMFLSLSYMTMEYGDTDVDGRSVFMKNLHDLTGEIRIELSKRERLNYALKSLNIIVLIPLLLIDPMKMWASSNFMPLGRFYDSQQGMVLRVIVIILILLCYIILRKVQQFDSPYYYKVGKKSIEDRLYEAGLYRIIDRIKPKKITSGYHQLKNILVLTRSDISVEGFVIRRWLTAIFLGIGMFMTIIFFHHNSRLEILEGPTISETFLGGDLTEEELVKAYEITEIDRRYLERITVQMTVEEIKTMLLESGMTMDEAQLVVKRLRNKQLEFYNQHIKVWEITLVLMTMILGYQLPLYYLLFKKSLLKMSIEDEISGFSSIVLMLMHHERLTVIEVLEWFEMYAVTFSEPIGDCLNNMTSGATEALEVLRSYSNHERYQRIIDGLILASKDITIKQAFDELDTEKAFYLEERKENNQRIVEKKINLGVMVGFLPVYGLIVIYMIIPMIAIGIRDMETYFSQLQI